MSFSTFLQSTDVHGLRFIADSTISVVRRLLWFMVFLASSVSLIILVIKRVQFFYSYPSVYNSVIQSDYLPVPAVAFCHGSAWFTTNNEIPIYLPRVDLDEDLFSLKEELQKVTDIDVAYFLYFSMNIRVFTEAEDGLYQLDQGWMDFFFNLTIDSSVTLTEIIRMSPSFTGQRFSFHGDPRIFAKIVERIKRMDRSIKINPENSLVSFLERRAAINSVPPQGGAICEVTLGGKEFSDCNWTTVMSQNGPCLVFNHDGGLVFRNQENGLKNKITVVLFDMLVSPIKKKYIDEFVDLNVKIFDPKEFPEISSIQFYHNIWSSKDGRYMDLGITRSYYSNVLDKPYNEKPCSEQRHSYCLRECIAKLMPCKLLVVYDAENAKHKPFCSLDQESVDFLAYNSTVVDTCKEGCPHSCESTHYKVEYLRGGDKRDNDRATRFEDLNDYDDYARFIHSGIRIYRHITISLSTGIPYEEYFQEPLYGPGVLVAEVGGYIGLFLGASTLTVYHWLEYMGIRLSSFIITRPMRKRGWPLGLPT